MVPAYFQPSFLNGLDTLSINKGDMECLECSYKAVIKHMIARPKYTPSCVVYLVTGSLAHYLLHCPCVEEIRNNFIISNPNVASLADNETALDPESALLPEDIRLNWDSSKSIYAWSRDFVYNVHNKFRKFYETPVACYSHVDNLDTALPG